jgi:tetratricopeptide (TPR) repeat protein
MTTLPSSDLREREGELRAVAAAVDDVEAGDGRLIVVEGPAGIGKSALLRAVRELLRARGIRCLSARGSELELRFPFGVVHQLFDDVVLTAGEDESVRLFSGAAVTAQTLFTEADAVGEPSGDELYRRLNGLAWLVRCLAGDEPLAIVCDDAHWADEPSLAFLAFLARRVEGQPLLLVAGTRPAAEQGRPALGALARDPAAVTLRLPALTIASVEGWIADSLAQDPDSAFVEACHVATGGIPFLVGELLREVADERLRPTAAGARRVGALEPGGMSAVVALRMAGLAPEAVRLAQALSVLGDGASVGATATLAQLGDTDASDAAAALVRAGIVDDRDGLAFSHPVMRATLYETMSASERASAHGRAAAMLRARHAPLDEVAVHLLLTEPGGDPEVVTILSTAARRAAGVGALDSACAYLERALAEPPLPETTAAVLTELGRAEGRLGAPTAPARLEQAMETATDLEGRAAAALELGRILKFGGEGGHGVDVLEPFERVADQLSPELREMLRLEFLGLGWLSGEARRRLGDRVDTLEDPGEVRSPLDAFVLAALAFNTAAEGVSADLAAERAERAAASGLLALDPAGPGGYGLLLAAVALMWSDRLEEASDVLERMLRESRRVGNRLGVLAASSMMTLNHMRRGALLEADRLAGECIELWREMGGDAAFLTAVWATYGDMGVDRGLPAPELRARLAAIDAKVHDDDALPWGLVLHARARLQLALGDLAAGTATLRATGRREESWRASSPAVVPWRSSLALALAQAGEHEEARASAADEVRRARAFGAPRAIGMALRAQALVGPPDEALATLQEAVAVLDASPARLEHARALAALGAEHARRGDRDQAVHALARAQTLAAACGAHGVEAGAHDALLELGATPQSPTEAPAAVPEIDVAAAVREALRALHRPHRLAASPLAPADGPLDARAQAVRDMLQHAVDRTFGDDPMDQLMRSVLLRAYFDAGTSHEAAADALYISRATYFRRLRDATARVTDFVSAARADASAAE